ncbi:MAG: SCO family protein [Gammaproteobacteria bacterium]|nr:SCO family protein [Gammaproteobacteria bacterium]
MNPQPKKANRIFLALLAITVFIALFFIANRKPQTPDVPAQLLAVMRPVAVELRPFTLIDHNSRPFTLDQLKDRDSLLFFGYTSCPDICPTTLTTLNLLMNKLKQESEAVTLPQIVFVSVDSQRDKPEKLASYTRYFNKDFISITGDKSSIDEFTRQFSAAYFIENSTAADNYQISHTSSIFMINHEAKLIAAFSLPHDVDTLAEQYTMIRDLYQQQ